MKLDDLLARILPPWLGYLTLSGQIPFLGDWGSFSLLEKLRNGISARKQEFEKAKAKWGVREPYETFIESSKGVPQYLYDAMGRLGEDARQLVELVHDAVDQVPRSGRIPAYGATLDQFGARADALADRLAALNMSPRINYWRVDVTGPRLRELPTIAIDCAALAGDFAAAAPTLAAACQYFVLREIESAAPSLGPEDVDTAVKIGRRYDLEITLNSAPTKTNAEREEAVGGFLPTDYHPEWVRDRPGHPKSGEEREFEQPHFEEVTIPVVVPQETLRDWNERKAEEEEWERYKQQDDAREREKHQPSPGRADDRFHERSDQFGIFREDLNALAAPSIRELASKEFGVFTENVSHSIATGHLAAGGFGAAAQEVAAGTVKSIGSQAAANGAYEIGESISSLAKGSGEAAAEHAGAAAAFFALAASAGIAAGAIAPGAPASKKKDAPQPKDSSSAGGSIGRGKVVQQITVVGSSSHDGAHGMKAKLAALAH